VNQDLIDGILWGGWHWQTPGSATANVTYYFAGPGEFGSFDSGWNTIEKTAYRNAVQSWANVANITFSETGSRFSATFIEHTARFSSPGNLGQHETPETGSPAHGYYNWQGFGWDWSNTNGGLQVGGLGYLTLVHEIGHGLGLAHPHDAGGGSSTWPGVTGPSNTGTNNLNQDINTVMSYNHGLRTKSVSGAANADNYGFVGGPMAFDIAAIQQLYGANNSYRTGSDTYFLPDANVAGTYFTCIWDAGGFDTIAYNGSRSVTINLNAASLDLAPNGGGDVSSASGILGGFTIARGVVIEAARSGSGADLIIGNFASNHMDGGAGDDSIFGSGGDDTLFGNIGNDLLGGSADNDTLIGGAGTDRFFMDGQGWDSIADFAGSQSDKIDLTSFFSVHNLAQVFDRSAQSGADTVVSLGGSNGFTIRNFVRANLAASHFTFQPVTMVEQIGVTAIAQVANTYFMDYASGSLGPQIKFGGAAISPLSFGSWRPIGAEQIAGNYQIVFRNGSTSQYAIWYTDNGGNVQSTSSVVSASSWLVQGLEGRFGQDLNGDGQIGATTTDLESASVTRLARVADSYFLYNGGATNGPQIRINGSYFVVGQSGNWAPIGAEQIAGNYQIVFRNGAADQYVVWFTDSNGNYQASTSLVTGASYYIQGLEARFGQNLNGDGTTGAVTTTIESASVTRLARVADSYFLYNGGTTNGPQIRINGSYFVVGQSGNWAPIGAEQIAGNYQIVFRNGAADQYVLWFTDSNGNYQASTPLVTGASYYIQGLEARFGQNLNGDGTTGAVTTVIETAGVTRLARVADSWFMYQGSTPTSGVQIRFGGAYAVFGQFGNWTPLGAEQIGGDYQIVFKNGTADQYVTWFTDSSGNFQTASGLMSGGTSALRALEVRFGQDFNSSGTIGASVLLTSDAGATLIPHGNDMVADFGGGTSVGNGAPVSHTPAGDMALLTNYIASAFATQAGDGMGIVPPAASSYHDDLTRPAV
jgi:serralysin